VLTGERLEDALARIRPVPFTKICYRVTDLEYLLKNNDHPLSGLGSTYVAGRFHQRGSYNCIYLGEDVDTVLREVLHGSKFPPKVLVSVDVRVSYLLDLTDGGVLEGLDTSFQEMTGRWEGIYAEDKIPPTQILGQAAFDSGIFEGILYLSRQSEGTSRNLALFKEKFIDTSYCRICDPDLILENYLITTTMKT